TLRRTDYDANEGVTAIYRLCLDAPDAKPQLVIDNARHPRWSNDGQLVYFLSAQTGSTQLWRVPAVGGTARQVTDYPIDVHNFKLSPNGQQVALSIDVFADCASLAASAERLAAARHDKASGSLHRQLFVRHWDIWHDGRHAQ